MPRIELAEMVKELREELLAAVEAGEGQKIRFELGEVTLEAQVEVTREGSGKGRLKFWVAEVEAGGGGSRTRTHKVVLSLKPEGKEGGSVRLRR